MDPAVYPHKQQGKREASHEKASIFAIEEIHGRMLYRQLCLADPAA